MQKSILKHLLAAMLLFMLIPSIYADAPPDPGGDPGPGGGTPVGGGSPVGSGFLITLTLAAAYGTKKIVNFRKEK
ncbi:MAG: hypothetical protein ACNA7V_00120 [Bacteroidales bacterium]